MSTTKFDPTSRPPRPKLLGQRAAGAPGVAARRTAPPRTLPHTRMPARVFHSSDEAARHVALIIEGVIREKASAGEAAVLGLPTGSTPVGVYRELIRLHREDRLDFSNVVTFNLDEYYPIDPDALQSYRRWMRENFFDHVNVLEENIHIPDGTLEPDAVAEFCERYERQIASAGGLDLVLLGIGRTGHIGFNEPGSPRDSRTRLVTLDPVTRNDAAADFFGEEHVPRQAITMGVGTILAARQVVILALGEHKAAVVRDAVEGPPTERIAASFLQEHPDAVFVLDEAAASELTAIKTPWLVGPVSWTTEREDLLLLPHRRLPAEGRSAQKNNVPLFASDHTRLVRRAVLWLSERTGKAILKLADADFRDAGLTDLVDSHGPAERIVAAVFQEMMDTVCTHPGGTTPQTVLVFSPHPDDDVISMGGTLARLADQGHDVHIAYMTSGNIAVFDHDALRYADFAAEYNQMFGIENERTLELEERVQRFLAQKKPGQPDTDEVLAIKALIRRTEARAAAKVAGVPEDRLHYLNLPFYQTGKVAKLPIGPEDVAIVRHLLAKLRPGQVYVAGDLSDPHGTHRMCAEAIFGALAELASPDADAIDGGTETEALGRGTRPDPDAGQGRAPLPIQRESAGGTAGSSSSAAGRHGAYRPEVWLYRGAWQEWGPHEIDRAVPLSPDDLLRKRQAIFKHESQKDAALFPGPSDSREFWQRAEQRNRHTAALYDRLGLPEYYALEGFVRWRGAAL